MLYSVWNWNTGLFDYYEGGKADRNVPLGKEDLEPNEAAVNLPKDAQRVGSGESAKGVVATTKKPKKSWRWIVGLALFGYGVWRVMR